MVLLIYRHLVCTFSKGLMYRVKRWRSVLPINDEDSSWKHLNGRRCRRKTMFSFTWSVLRFCFCLHDMLSLRVVERKHPYSIIKYQGTLFLFKHHSWPDFFRTFSPINMLRMHIFHGNLVNYRMRCPKSQMWILWLEHISKMKQEFLFWDWVLY